MKIKINFDRPTCIVGILLESNELKTQLADLLIFNEKTSEPIYGELTTDNSFQEYFENEWEKHFETSKSGNRHRNLRR